jgi:lipooligosaccharide transport system ATP-binding protein
MTAIVQATSLRKQYGNFMAINGVGFSIQKGKCFGFLGPNGAGKTTTLRAILGLTPITDGSIRVFDLPIPEKAREIRARVGVVPQADNLDPDFTVRENLKIYASYFGIPKKDLNSRIEKLLKFASLTERAESKTEHLSGGMQRRLTLARALINDPELIVLDEPTTGLDPQARHMIWSQLNDLKEQGTTLLLTTHYMEEAERLCDELVIMDQGAILDQGTPAVLIKKNVEPEVVEIRGITRDNGTFIKKFPELRTVDIGTSLYCYTQNASSLIEQLREQPDLTFLHRPAGLEDVFLKLTGKDLKD